MDKTMTPESNTDQLSTTGSGRLHKLVSCEISDRELQAFDRGIPIFWQIRSRLNKAGFKFKDDRKISSILNEKPEPLGVLVHWYDVAKGITYFKQTLSN